MPEKSQLKHLGASRGVPSELVERELERQRFLKQNGLPAQFGVGLDGAEVDELLELYDIDPDAEPTERVADDESVEDDAEDESEDDDEDGDSEDDDTEDDGAEPEGAREDPAPDRRPEVLPIGPLPSTTPRTPAPSRKAGVTSIAGAWDYLGTHESSKGTLCVSTEVADVEIPVSMPVVEESCLSFLLRGDSQFSLKPGVPVRVGLRIGGKTHALEVMHVGMCCKVFGSGSPGYKMFTLASRKVGDETQG